MKILLISDDAPLNLLLQQELEEEGYEMFISDDVYKANDVLLITSFDLVIIGGMLFFPLVHDIKRANPSLPVIMYSAYDESHVRERCSPAAYVAKSSDLTDLFNAIRQLLDP